MKYFFSILIFLIIGIGCIEAQDFGSMPNTQTEAWLGIEFETNINDDWKFGFKQETRGTSQNQLYDRSILQLNAQYRWNGIRLGIAYRYIHLNDQDGLLHEIENHHRWNFRIGHRLKVNKFNSKILFQYQSRRQHLPNTNRYIKEIRNYWRVKYELEYNIKGWKLDPEIGIEWFLKPKRFVKGQNNKFRLSIGTSYRIQKSHQFQIKYSYEREEQKWNPDAFHILSFNYRYQLSFKNKKYKHD